MKTLSKANDFVILTIHGISTKGQDSTLERHSNIVSLEHYLLKDVMNEYPENLEMTIKYSKDNPVLLRECNIRPYWDVSLQIN